MPQVDAQQTPSEELEDDLARFQTATEDPLEARLHQLRPKDDPRHLEAA
jgi:hypothetical protein